MIIMKIIMMIFMNITKLDDDDEKKSYSKTKLDDDDLEPYIAKVEGDDDDDVEIILYFKTKLDDDDDDNNNNLLFF